VNPTVVAQAAPALEARRLDVDAVGASAAPREISRSSLAVETVGALASVASATPSHVDVSDVAAPALRGPIEAAAPVGPSVGPKPVAVGGTSVGTGPAVVADAGSSVREGALSTRDVLGSPDGPRLASVNTRVGTSHLRGPGGEGTGFGGLGADCDGPEVDAYVELVRQRTYSRWATMGAPVGKFLVKLRFALDVGGSARDVQFLASDDARVGAMAADALRSASPFPPMTDPVRCLAGRSITATFRLESETVAN
jgi:hypothetical protein